MMERFRESRGGKKMLLTAREDYPDPGKRCVSATFNHQIGFLFQGGVMLESGSSGCVP